MEATAAQKPLDAFRLFETLERCRTEAGAALPTVRRWARATALGLLSLSLIALACGAVLLAEARGARDGHGPACVVASHVGGR